MWRSLGEKNLLISANGHLISADARDEVLKSIALINSGTPFQASELAKSVLGSESQSAIDEHRFERLFEFLRFLHSVKAIKAVNTALPD
jgi:hypothetical protein